MKKKDLPTDKVFYVDFEEKEWYENALTPEQQEIWDEVVLNLNL